MKENELIVKFEKTNMGQPFISAIVLTMGTLEDTDYMDRQEYIEEWKLRYPNKTKEEKKLDK